MNASRQCQVRSRFAQLAILLLALTAFCAQQWAAQTHWHAAPGATAGLHAGVQPAAEEAPTGGSGLPHPDCLWCHAAAHAAAAAPPPQWPALPISIAHSAFRPSAGTTAAFPSPLAWAWYSRGPPRLIEPAV
ncbi:MAG: hypothetical protein M3Y79_15140 [Pseudomonadota bacterium]|nr:hypothetical protein [Pseudomonadota bacterium]